MNFYSPLRYPGGKNRLASFIANVCALNNINGYYIEPYAGGASVALYLLLNGYVREITINDYDISIYAFWHSILYNTDQFYKKIRATQITVKEWENQKKIYTQEYIKENPNLLRLGFATFFLNRTNYSGVIDGGIIGGKEQKGKYKLDCRFSKENLIKRIEKIAKYKDSIHLFNKDALELVNCIKDKNNSNAIFYFDPPYYLKGPSLYLNHYKHSDHESVSNTIRQIKGARWIVSYDDVPEIKQLYNDASVQSKTYTLSHNTRTVRVGREIIFATKELSLPENVL